MLNPKAHGPAPAPRRSSQPETGSVGEVRSFAPRPSSARRKVEPLEPGLAADVTAAAAIAAEASDVARRRVLIVIPTLNEERVISSVLERILDDEGLEDPLVVVADGGSADETRAIVRDIAVGDPRVRLIHNPGRLQSAGLNLAAATASSGRAWIARIDAHAEYPKNYVSTLIAEARRTGASSVVVSMDTVGEGAFQRGVAAAQNSLLGAGGSAHRRASRGQWVDHGHHALFEVAAFEAVGGYDETFSHNEDAEFDLRLAGAGGRIWLTDSTRIRYFPRSTPGALWRQYFSYGKGRARTVLKHYTPLKFRQALPLAVAPTVAAAALAPLTPLLMLPALAWLMASLSFGLVLSVRQRDMAVALAGPAAIIMHLAWSSGFWAQLFTHASRKLAGEIQGPSRQAVS